MRRMKKVSVAAALAAVTAVGLLPPADAVVGQVRATGDYREVVPNINNGPSRAKSGPNLAVNPNNPNHVVTLHQELETEECEVGASFDGGKTWAGGGELQAPISPTNGYRLVGSDGAVYTFGTARNLGSTAGTPLFRPVVGSATTPSGNGYWLVASDGGIFAYGDAGFHGSTGGTVLNQPVVGMAATASGKGYWLVAADGGIFAFGDAGFFGSAGSIPLNKPVVGMAPTPTGKGYWLVASDGGIFAYGDAQFFGSTGGIPLNKPIVGMAPTASGKGYWLVASDGGVFNYGDAGFFGSAGSIPLNKPIVGIAPSETGKGYNLVASDGGIFSYGDAKFFGSTGGSNISAPIVGMAMGNRPNPAFPTSNPGPCDVTGHGAGNIGQRSIAFGSGNNVYVTWVSTRQLDVTGWTLLLSKSTDGGLTYTTTEVAASGVAPAPDFYRPELVVDRRSASTDRVIIAALDRRASRAMIVRSEDSGASWTAPVEASRNNPLTNPAPTWTSGAVTNAGDAFIRVSELTAPVLGPANASGIRPIFVAWRAAKNSGTCPPNCETAGQTGSDAYIVVARSADNGVTWTRTRAINVQGFLAPSGAVNANSNFPRLAAGLNGELYLTFNQGPGVPASNNCGAGPFPSGATGAGGTQVCPSYTGAGFKAADHFMNPDMDVFALRSLDQGSTWGNLQQLNEPKKPGLAVAEITQTRHPEIAVAPDGRVDIVWEDRRHWYLNTTDRRNAVTPQGSGNDRYRCVHSHSACDDPRLGDTYYSYSINQGASFSFNRRLNDRSHNNDVGYDYRFSAYWDYGPAVAALGNERLLVADMDARFGNFQNDAMDIVLRQVELNTSAPVPVEHIGTGGAVDLSVAISKLTYPGGGESVHGQGFTSRPWTRPVIVNEADMPSALAGGVLARGFLGPVLASSAAGLSPTVQEEIDRLDAVGAFIIGDETKLSSNVQAGLVAAGVPAAQIVRIAGATPADVAAQIALTLDRRRNPCGAGGLPTDGTNACGDDKTSTPPLPAFDAVIIANPNSASAASAAALAANRRLPILYVDQNSVPAATTAAIATLGVTQKIIVGSPGVISEAVAASLGTGVTRLSGADQFATSRAVVTESLNRGLPRNIVYVADGNEPMHAALLGAGVGRMGGLLIMTPGGSAATAVTTLTAAPFNLGPYIDKVRTSDLTGTAVVANDPA